MDDLKENNNDVGLGSRISIRNSRQPLSEQLTMNSLSESYSKAFAGRESPFRVSPNRVSNSPSEILSPSIQSPVKSKSSISNKIEKQYADLLSKYNRLLLENKELEKEVQLTHYTQQDHDNKLASYQKLIKNINNDHMDNKDQWDKQVSFYERIITELQGRVVELTEKIKSTEDATEIQVLSLMEDMDSKYGSLLKEFKVLQSNFELEKNSKMVLIDQIEYLTKENDNIKIEMNHMNSDVKVISSMRSNGTLPQLNESRHTFGVLTDDSLTDNLNENISDSGVTDINNFENSDFHIDLASIEDSEIFRPLGDEVEGGVDTSSPIKHDDNSNSLKVTSNFTFPSPVKEESNKKEDYNFQLPPSPDPGLKELKRQSLPSRLVSKNNKTGNDHFILSPLKLASNSYFQVDSTEPTEQPKRNSSSLKFSHARYSSHDILPIKVEFEPYDSALRSTSGPDKFQSVASLEKSKRIESIEELPESIVKRKVSMRDLAFNKLNGYQDVPSNRSSYTTTSSKKSSVFNESSVISSEGTKQELMKLKFELHSLKLHNEKLLSYIGFELQKQKNNIRKLSHKRSKTAIEYSDAKLIEKSRDMLINKKRVFRSVSVNPITPKDNPFGPNLTALLSGGLTNSNNIGLGHNNLNDYLYDMERSDEENFNYPAHSHSSFKNRNSSIQSRYLNQAEINDYWDSLEYSRSIKKYRSQVFRSSTYDSTFDSLVDSEENAEDCDRSYFCEDKTCSESDTDTDTDAAPPGGILSSIGALFHTSQNSIKARDTKLDSGDSLKYKFLSIAIGIIIIGLRCSDYQSLHTH